MADAHMNQSVVIENPTGQFREDAKVIGLVGLGHAISHFSQLVLPPLFPLLKAEFGVSNVQLGVIMTAFFVVSGIGQATAGFIVDRIGARSVLFAGIAIIALAIFGLAMTHDYFFLVACGALLGLGNSIFHPANFTILNHRVSQPRLSHAFSTHSVSGFIGWAIAPLFVTSLAVPFGWRGALIGASALVFAVLVLLLLYRKHLELPHSENKTHAQNDAAASTFGFLRLPLVWMCFGFFLLTALALSGIQTFTPSALQQMYAISPWLAGSSITLYMLAAAVGTIVGGFVANGTANQDRIIAAAFISAAMMAFIIASAAVPTAITMMLLALIGFAGGLASPSRDLLVRAAAPKNATGRVYGVVYSGLDSGQALGPLLFGMLMDAHHPSGVFVAIGIFQLLVVLTATGVGNKALRSRQ